MAKIYDSVIDLIGNTPMVRLNKINPGCADVVVKLEYFNPALSVKDRPARCMILQAERTGLIDKDTIIIEPTSGNTGIGLALVCAVKGYKLILTMPENMSIERRKMLKGYGAELVLTPADLGMKGAVDEALALASHFKKTFIPSQFSNPDNPLIHEFNTGEEIWDDTDGKIDIFAASFGTGGTLSGVGRCLKKHNPEVKIYGIEPSDSPLVSKGYAAPHGLQGIGANFIPQNLDLKVVDKILTVTQEDALKTARLLATKEGILCGISSGANVHCALELAKLEENRGKLIVTVITDYGERYLSTKLFEEEAQNVN